REECVDWADGKQWRRDDDGAPKRRSRQKRDVNSTLHSEGRFLADNVQTIQVRPQGFWNGDRSVLLLVILKNCNPRPSHREPRSVQCMDESHFAVGWPKPNVCSPRLEITEVTAG